MATRTLMLFRRLVVLAAFLATALPGLTPRAAAYQAPAMTVEGVIKMADAGISEDVIITRLRKANKAFDLSDDQMIRLKKAKVSDNIVKVMIDPGAAIDAPPPPLPAIEPPPVLAEEPKTAPDPDDPNSPHDPGIYIYAKDAEGKMRMVILDRAPVEYKNQWQPGQMINFGAIAQFAGAQATVQTKETMPVFYLSWENSGAQPLWDASLTTPNQFRLIRTVVVKGVRKTALGPGNLVTASVPAKGHGAKDENAIQTKAERVGNRFFYKVTPLKPLLPGEYVFVANMPLTQDVFDFGVGQ